MLFDSPRIYIAKSETPQSRNATVPFDVTYTPHAGGPPGDGLAAQSFWVASDAGTGSRTLTWHVASGDWSVVIMNADGSSGIDADLGVAATLSGIRDIAVGALIGGGLMLIMGTGTVVSTLSTRGRRRHDRDRVAP
jgi:hypothetical protein